MLHREMIAVFCEIYTKHTNIMSCQKVKYVTLRLVVHIITTKL
jgi:hypothetical protein